MSSQIGKLWSSGTKTGEEFKALVKETVKAALVALAANEEGFKITTGLSPALVRFKLEKSLGEKPCMESVVSLAIFVIVNSYRIAERDYPDNEHGNRLRSLKLKAGGEKGKSKKDMYTVVAVLAAFPDICAAVMLEEPVQKIIAKQTVGGWQFRGNAFPFWAYLNGSQSLAVMASASDPERKMVCLAIMAHQQCYISSRFLAGSKTPPSDEKIKEQRKKSFDFLMNAKSAFSDKDRIEAFKGLGLDSNSEMAMLVGLGKQLPGDYSTWPLKADDVLSNFGKVIGWYKV